MISERGASAVVAAFCLLGVGCADLSRGPASARSDGGADVAGEGDAAEAGASSFAAAIHPLLLSACGGCHVEGGQAGDTQLLFSGDAGADYAIVSRFVNTSAPAGSRLLSKLSGNGHGGGSVFAA